VIAEKASDHAGVRHEKKDARQNLPFHQGNGFSTPPSNGYYSEVCEQRLREVKSVNYAIPVESLLDAHQGSLKDQGRSANARYLERAPRFPPLETPKCH
jgi:hypothetical protein